MNEDQPLSLISQHEQQSCSQLVKIVKSLPSNVKSTLLLYLLTRQIRFYGIV
jgi:hypothetical protein